MNARRWFGIGLTLVGLVVGLWWGLTQGDEGQDEPEVTLLPAEPAAAEPAAPAPQVEAHPPAKPGGKDDPLWIRIYSLDPSLRGAEKLFPIFLDVEEKFGLPARWYHSAQGVRTPIESIHDKAVRLGLDTPPDYHAEVQGETPALGVVAGVTFEEFGVIISLPEERWSKFSAEEIKSWVKDQIVNLNADYVRVHLPGYGEPLLRKYYRPRRRTSNASGLYWLNFFGGAEFERQGGEQLATALAAVPGVVVERMERGILVQVGAGPFEATSTEAENLLLRATWAMPPVVGKRR